MKDLIRKILKEDDELDWLPAPLNVNNQDELFELLTNFLHGSKFWIENVDNCYTIEDNTGIYLVMNEDKSNLNYMYRELERVANGDTYYEKSLCKEYKELFDYLQPIFDAENIGDDLIKEQEEDLDWLPEPMPTVIITDEGCHYPTYLEAMVELDIDGAREFLNKYSKNWLNDMRISLLDYDKRHEFVLNEIPSTIIPENGDVCWWYDDRYVARSEYRIYKLVRIKDGGQFIMHDGGFKPYEE